MTDKFRSLISFDTAGFPLENPFYTVPGSVSTHVFTEVLDNITPRTTRNIMDKITGPFRGHITAVRSLLRDHMKIYNE